MTASPISLSGILSSSAPVMAWLASVMMPSSLAMATAVSLWSPVIMTGRMPASRHSTMAGLTSGRTGSIMPVRPRKHRSCSRKAGSLLAGFSAQSRLAAARTRRAWSAMFLLAARISARLASVMGSTLPFSR